MQAGESAGTTPTRMHWPARWAGVSPLTIVLARGLACCCPDVGCAEGLVESLAGAVLVGEADGALLPGETLGVGGAGLEEAPEGGEDGELPVRPHPARGTPSPAARIVRRLMERIVAQMMCGHPCRTTWTSRSWLPQSA